MTMSPLTLALIAAFVTITGIAYFVWDDRFRHIPLANFGIEQVQRVGSFESAEWRDGVWKRGWLTSAEWRAVNARQIRTIDAELQRRNLQLERE